jgi:hypothetical protein
MKKTFDQLFNEIVGENVVNTPPQQGNQQQPQQNQQQQNNQQQPQQNQQKYQQASSANKPALDLEQLSAELAKINDASKIKELLAGLIPNAGNKA